MAREMKGNLLDPHVYKMYWVTDALNESLYYLHEFLKSTLLSRNMAVSDQPFRDQTVVDLFLNAFDTS